MIEIIEQKLIHWGHQCRYSRAGGHIRCALDTDGQPQARGRSSAGLAIIYDVQLDRISEEVNRAVASLILPIASGGLGTRTGEELKALARIRYVVASSLTIEQQLIQLNYKTRNTYFKKLHQLHEFIADRLKVRM